MKENSFLYFENPKVFLEFLKKFNVLNEWKISSGKLNDRGKRISSKWYYRYLKDKFNSKNMFRRSVSISEVVSWLDSFVIMRRVITNLLEIGCEQQIERIEISCEYMIEMSKKMRIDYLLKYDDIVLLLEFRLVNDYEKIKTTWTKKKSELLIYKELCKNYMSADIKILTFAFISLYEYELGVPNASHIDYNNKQTLFLCDYIRKFMIKNNS